MTKDNDERATPDDKVVLSEIKDLPLTLDNPAFSSDDMIVCSKCSRANPPTRTGCFYCGEPLAIGQDKLDIVKPNLRRLESWEKGFNLVTLRPIPRNSNIGAIAKELGLERDDCQKLILAGSETPLARVESIQEGNLLFARLNRLGVHCGILADEGFELENSPVRLRAIDLSDHEMQVTEFNTSERRNIAAADVTLIVNGILLEAKTTSFERRKRGKSELIEQNDISSDEPVIDLYSKSDRLGFRIRASGFDFSCLGDQKSLLAAENMPRLLQKLQNNFVGAKVVLEYKKKREALGIVWEMTERKDFEGIRRHGFGKTDFGNVVTVNNLDQFNRFSRMHRQLI